MKPHAVRDLGQFIQGELGPRLLPRVLVLKGPAVNIDARACSVLAPVLQEIAETSVPFSTPGSSGHAVISWTRDERGGCVIEWDLPDEAGQSLRAEPAAALSLTSEIMIGFEVSDKAFRISVPTQYVAYGDAMTVARVAADPLRGQTLLVVEDQLIIALDLEMLLRQQGAADVHIVGTATDALKLIASTPPDAAVLDVNLGSSTSFPVAHELMRLGVPFIFATGYGKEVDFPAEFRTVPLVGKPYCAAVIRDALVASRMTFA